MSQKAEHIPHEHERHAPECLNESANESIYESAHEGPQERAVEIAGVGKYTTILETLKSEGLLEQEVVRVKNEYALESIPFLNENDFEMYTVLDLYDPVTAKHCLDTYRIAHEKLEKEIVPGVSLSKLLQKREGVGLDQFYRACLFHDIGKVEVPRCVIRNRTNEGQMLECLHTLYSSLYHEKDILKGIGLREDSSITDIDRALSENHIRSVYIVPAREVLSAEGLAEIRRRGFTGDETLMDIIRPHEMYSGVILAQAGYDIESKIAGMHHNYDHRQPEYPLAVSALHISVDIEDLLHLADLTDALRSSRSYNNGGSDDPKIMHVIVEHARERSESERFQLAAYLWLTDDLRMYDAAPHDAKPAEEQERDEAYIAEVRAFLTETGKTIEPITP